MGHPGKRAPTVEICDSDQPYEPLAMRQHATGPYPLDPNLIAQGVPPDDRVTFEDHIFGPIQGTPMPPGPPQPPAAAVPPPPAAPAPAAPDGGAAAVAPSSFTTGSRPSVAVAEYNPRTGMYVTPDGQIYRQSDLVAGVAPKTWKDMLPT
jgi:hypothetical protein